MEHWVVEDIGRAPVIHKDLVGVVVSHSNANHECILVKVVESLDIFLCKPIDRVFNSCHLRSESRQLDILNHL